VAAAAPPVAAAAPPVAAAAPPRNYQTLLLAIITLLMIIPTAHKIILPLPTTMNFHQVRFLKFIPINIIS